MMNYQEIIDKYVNWIKDNTSLRKIGEGKFAVITTPFLDSHNDHLSIYVRRVADKIFLTDDGYIMNDLKMSGMELNTPKREKLFKIILNGFGVRLGDEKNDLYVEANIDNVGQKKHALVQAMLAVGDMYSLSQENIFSFFKEDVELFFKTKNILYTKDIKISGKTGFDHNIDFAIPASRSYPERLIKTLNLPKKDPALGIIFAFADIAATREQKTRNIVFYNDRDRSVPADVISAFKNYDVEGIPWSAREKHVEELMVA